VEKGRTGVALRWNRPSRDHMHDDSKAEATADANKHANDRCTPGNCRELNQPVRRKGVDSSAA
jgi:hypothetical protein